MRLFFIALLSAVTLSGQVTVVSTDPAPAPPVLNIVVPSGQTAYPGGTVNLAVQLANSTGLGIQSIGFTVPTGAVNVQASAGSAAAQKAAWCGSGNCLLLGCPNPLAPTSVCSETPYSDGQVFTFAYPVPSSAVVGSTLAISLPSPIFASDMNGNAITINPGSVSIPVMVNPVCQAALIADINQYLAAPSQADLGAVLVYLGTIIAGTCH